MREAPGREAQAAQAIELLAGAVKTYGFRVALLVPELRKGRTSDQVFGRIGHDLRELAAMFGATALLVDPAEATVPPRSSP